MAKGFTKPINGKPHDIVLPADVAETCKLFIARRKLQHILKFKAIKGIPFTASDLVEMFVKQEVEKRGRWSFRKTVTSVNADSLIVTVPGKAGNKLTTVFEDTRMAIPDRSFAKLLKDDIDALDDMKDIEIPQESNDNSESTPDTAVSDIDFGTNAVEDDVTASIGNILKIFWSLEDQYYSGTVNSAADYGLVNLNYDDGGNGMLHMSKEVWNYSSAIPASSVRTTLPLSIRSQEASVLKQKTAQLVLRRHVPPNANINLQPYLI
eukprot:gb/GEZJ01000749.1/.p2 GENE.gb/GEZJ01000749.1/~~gb/GEZJ01000749.1/.p2  ORF type:complete len:265 (-),score=37.34 gb/GEZJ01000749.1/:1718-2512(-)